MDDLNWKRIRASLSSISAIRKMSWWTGEVLYHTLSPAVRSLTRSPSISTSTQDYSDPMPLSLYPRSFITRRYPKINNPILTATHVDDYGSVDYVADPFLYLTDDSWHLFFEVFNQDKTPAAVIGHAVSRDQGVNWEYNQVVLDTETHLSFPFVFSWQGNQYMIPNEVCDPKNQAVSLFNALSFPNEWKRVATLVEPDHDVADRVVFRWGKRWRLFVAAADGSDKLYIYHSTSLLNGWKPHANNPVKVDEPRKPGGRPVINDDTLVLFFQDGPDYYSESVHAFEIKELTPDEYDDERLDNTAVIEASGEFAAWNGGRMHTFDPWEVGDHTVCAVDGDIDSGRTLFGAHWAIGLYTLDQLDTHE